MFLTVIMPALNEEKNISQAIDDTLSAFKKLNIEGEIIVINDGSIDNTPNIVKNKINEYPDKIRMITHDKPKGIGASFWDGVDNAKGDVICMLPGDNENIPLEIMQYIYLMNHVDMIIPFVFNLEVRSLFRKMLSYIYKFIINNTFFISLNYTNGTVLYRKSILTELKHRDTGFFYQTDILVRLIKKGYLFAEVPYKLKRREKGISKALTLHSLKEVIKGYFRLLRDIYFTKREKTSTFISDSVSARRYNEEFNS